MKDACWLRSQSGAWLVVAAAAVRRRAAAGRGFAGKRAALKRKRKKWCESAPNRVAECAPKMRSTCGRP